MNLRRFFFHFSWIMAAGFISCNWSINNNNTDDDRKLFFGEWQTVYQVKDTGGVKVVTRYFEFISDSTYRFNTTCINPLTNLEIEKDYMELLGKWQREKPSKLHLRIEKQYKKINGIKTLQTPTITTIDYDYAFTSSTVAIPNDSLILSYKYVVLDDLGNPIKDTTYIYRYKKQLED